MAPQTYKFYANDTVGDTAPDDLEMAAAIAAISMFMKSTCGGIDLAGKSSTGGSAWQNAGRLEATHRIKIDSPALLAGQYPLWRRLLFVIALFCTIASVCPEPALAENQSAESKNKELSLNANSDIAWRSDKYLSQANNGLTLKVGILLGAHHVDLIALDGARIVNAYSGNKVAVLPPNSHYTLAIVNARGSDAQLSFTAMPSNRLSPNLGLDASATEYGANNFQPVIYSPAGTPYLPQSFKIPLKFGQLVTNANDWSNGTIDSAGTGSSYLSSYIILPGNSSINDSDSKNSEDGMIMVNGRGYRGALRINFNFPPASGLKAKFNAGPGAAFDLINVVDLEDYLLSVVPAEMPSNWPIEALKAQAIAARSYALANAGKHAKDGYDVKADTSDQVYLGVASESDLSNQAVAQTAGLVLEQDNKIISAYFHSTSGGSTETPENVWGKPLPFLQAVADYDDASPHFVWMRRLTVNDIEKALSGSIGQLLNLSVVSRGVSGRVSSILAQGTKGSQLISGETSRYLLHLPSTLYNIGLDDNAYLFAGRGFGHGLGMSQYGAKALAEQGYNAAQILTYYYKDVSIENMAGVPAI